MKKILFLLLFLISISASAQKWYVATTGSDTHGKGTLADPWLTVKHAADTITDANGFAGDTIYVLAGTYTENAQITLSDSISLMGVMTASDTTIIECTVSIGNIALIKLESSAEGTNGNQSISYIKLDGTDLTASWGIYVNRRSNVSIHNVVVQDFEHRGIVFNGSVGTNVPPNTYSTNNKLYDSYIYNCAYTYGGCVQLGGQADMLIYNNSIDLPDRGADAGFGIKYYNGGFNKGIEIYDNYIAVPPKGTSTWEFSIELWYSRGGIHIHDNVLKGTLDIGGSGLTDDEVSANDAGGYGYALKVYSNTFGQDALEANTVRGIDMEGSITGGVYIYRNYFKYVPIPISNSTTLGEANIIEDVYIYYNILDSVGRTDTNGAYGIYIQSSSDSQIDNINIWNNVIQAKQTAPICLDGVRFANLADGTNISIRNNIINGFSNACVYTTACYIDILSVENNLFYGNGSSNNPTYSGGLITNKTEQNNLTSDPDFVGTGTPPADYKLTATSPAINAGIDVGLSYDYEGKPIYLLPDIGAYEFGTFPASTGLGWKPKYYKENIRDTLNINKGWKIKGEPVVTSARSLNRVEGVTSNIQEQLDALNIPVFQSSITIAGDTTVTAVVGKIVYQAADSSFYGCRSTVAPKKWYKLHD